MVNLHQVIDLHIFLKKSINKPKIITVQHSNSNYNLLYSFNKKRICKKK